MNKVRETTQFVVEHSQAVSINMNAVIQYAKGFYHKSMQHWLSAAPFQFSHFSDEQKLNFILIFNALSFSYWGEPKWMIEVNKQSYDGAWGMIMALGNSINNGSPLLDFNFCATLDKINLASILRGNIEIPLLGERAKIINEIGKVLIKKYQGRFSKLLNEADGDALKLVSLIVRTFPSFLDISEFNGRKIYFLKRAQLLVSDIYQIFDGKNFGNLKNIDQLTACADYKLPQILRKEGILEYASDLSEKIDNRVEIPHNSEEEIEIRANTIWAVEYIKAEVKKTNPKIMSTEINDHLWLVTQEKFPNDKPYHRTRTLAY